MESTISLPPVLQEIVAGLESRAHHSSQSLATALGAKVSLDDVVDWVRFDTAGYRRNLVVRRPDFELRVLCYLPNQRTSLHGHYGAACAFRVLKGTSTEIRLGSQDYCWRPGDVVQEVGLELVHQVVNLTGEPVVSLHAYSPPLPIDQPRQRPGGHVVVIGGGASGAALAIHLLGQATAETLISIVERRQWLGREPGYATLEGASLFPDRPQDFLEWAGEAEPAPARYGEYIEARLGQAIKESVGKIWFHRSEPIAATPDGVQLSDGQFLRANAVVLAQQGPRGAARDWTAMLFRHLLRDRHAQADAAAAGVACTREGHALDGAGRASPWLHVLRGVDGADTAAQAVALARRLRQG
jgi:hypothetical protein